MKREILFRGKPLGHSGWIDGYLTENQDGFSRIRPTYWDRKEIGCRVVPETIGQYTGTKDKNEIEIFEGDIVKCHDRLTGNDFIGFVDYADNSFRINDGAMTHYRWIDYECEAIGNIYDNPELMKDR